MVIIGGRKYYTLDEAAKLGGVSVRTLRRWMSAGRLSDFIYPFRSGPGEMLYRLEAPDENDVKNKKGEWMVVRGGAVHESIRSS